MSSLGHHLGLRSRIIRSSGSTNWAALIPHYASLEVVFVADTQFWFQDNTGTTPVTAISQPIGYWRSVQGTDFVITQGTSGAKPTSGKNGSLWKASFDGTDALAGTFDTFAQPFKIICLAENISLMNQYRYDGGPGGSNRNAMLGISGQWNIYGGSNVLGVLSEPGSAGYYTSIATQDGGSSKLIYPSGNTIGPGTNIGTDSLGGLTLGNRWQDTGDNGFTGGMRFWAAGNISDQDAEDIRLWLVSDLGATA